MCLTRGVFGSILGIACTAVAAAAGPATRPPAAALQEEQATKPSAEELSSLLERGDAILLQSGVFDPLVEPAPGVNTAAPVRGDEGTFLVQFRRDLSEADRAELEAVGVRFIDYLPRRAYVLRASPATFAHLQSNPLVRWMDAFRGGHKLPGVLRSSAWTEPVFLDVRLLPDESPLALLDRLRGLDEAVQLAAIHGEAGEGATLRVLVPGEHVHTFAEQVAADSAVWSLVPWYLPEIHNDDSIWVEQSYDTVHKRAYDFSAPIWKHSITGVGQRIGIADTGLDSDMCFFRYNSLASQVTPAQSPALPGTGTIDTSKRVAAYYVMPHATAYDGNAVCNGVPQGYHGTHTSSTLAGDNYATFQQPPLTGHDIGDGMAPHAKLIFQDVGNDTSGCLEGLGNDFRLIARQAYDAGARVHSNSWGSDTAGDYTSFSSMVDEAAYDLEDLLFVFSAGNAGPTPTSVGSPATAKNCVAVGATGHGGSNQVESYSSRGLTRDGRVKPELVAPGGSIVSASGDSSHTSNNCGFKVASGTSTAAPAVAGGAALLRQYFTDGFYPSGVKTAADAMAPSAALLRAALINGAIDVAATSQATMLDRTAFDIHQGFGRIHLDNVAFFATPTRDARRTRVWDRWNAHGLSTGQMDTYTLQVAAGQPLKVALAWTDPPGSLLIWVKRVNDLDLEVIDPLGNRYRGNWFSDGVSIPSPGADTLNTAEVFFARSPTAGLWTLRVKASDVPGIPAKPGSTRQGYALVATYGDCSSVPAAPAGVVASDQASSGIGLTWNAVPGATEYQIYRADGSCGAAALSFRYLGKTPTTGYVDPIQGGYPYAYKIRASTSCIEGPLSPCVTATSTGNCTLVPAFQGLASAVNDTTTSACDVLLDWNPGSSRCPLGPGISYTVYRSSTPYFTPGPATQLAPAVTGDSYRDATTAPNRGYYYRVLAEDGTVENGGPVNGGNVDGNTAFVGATATSSVGFPGTWSDDVDGTVRLTLQAPWRSSSESRHSGALAYHSGPDGSTYPANTCASATTPPILLQTSPSPVLSYWARWGLENSWDGVVVEISTNDGASWSDLPPIGGYSSTFEWTGNPPINGCGYASTHGAFAGGRDWHVVTHSLAAYGGRTVRIRWRLSTDPATEFEGFYLDDLTISSATVPASCGMDLRLISSGVASDRCSGGGGGGGNGILEAGEDADISVNLQNLGDQGGTALTGTLTTSVPGVLVTRPTASFTAVPSGGTGSSTAPHFGVWVQPTVPCGATIPLTLQLDAAQGSVTQILDLRVGPAGGSCSQAVCNGAVPVENGTGSGMLRLAKTGSEDLLQLTFGLSCHTADSTVYWGQSLGAMTGIAWIRAACGFGPNGWASVSLGMTPPGWLYYFVVVPSNGGKEGSYGRNSAGVERPSGSSVPTCNLPRQLGGTCP